jgi:hypothetical protein
VSRPGHDGADSLLAIAVWLLPAGRREWGQAMRAELAAVSSTRARWWFAAGCARTVVTQPAVLRRNGYPALMIGTLVTVLGWSSTVAYPPLRWGLVTLVSVLVGVSWLGRRPGILGPVAEDRAARLVRAGGHLLVGAMTIMLVLSTTSHHDPEEQAHNAVPILTVLLTSHLLGFVAVTSRRTATTGRVLATGIAAGVTIAVLCITVVLVAPPIPANIGPALAMITVAMAAAAAAANAGPRGSTERGMLAALCAGTIAALLIFILVALLSSYGPARLIPDLVPAALTPADDLANSRIEIQDPYVALLFLASLLAVGLSIASIATKQRRTPPRRDHAGRVRRGRRAISG